MDIVEGIRHLPILTTIFGTWFTVVLYRHWKASGTRYLFWWLLGVAMFALGTLSESLTTLFDWNPAVFRLWYISGALLGGAPLAQGTVYLLAKKRTADRLTVALLAYITIAAVFVLLTPLDRSLVEANRLSGAVMEWSWVRLFSPLVNTYALIFLVGGAAWSAWRYWRRGDRTGARVIGNVFIAIGGILPGIGGSFTRAGYVEVLYATELTGLVLIYLGYRAIANDTTRSIHASQQPKAAALAAD